jgi:NADH-quinone oxidoreductase subunit L
MGLLLVLLPMLSAGLVWSLPPKRAFVLPMLSLLAGFFLIFWAEKQAHWVWFSVAGIECSLSLSIDRIAQKMLFLVQFVGFWVILFSAVYMEKEVHKKRYFSLLSLFLAAMNGLLIFKNLLIVYFFWEWVGLCSFLLIGFWYEEASTNQASFKAFMLNKIGDSLMLAGIFLAQVETGSWDYPEPDATSMLWAWLILAGTVSKSAQLPLSIWLPDAMKGPTPVSALIHAATMVAAGIYLAIRISPWVQASQVLAYWGLATALLGALSAAFQTDIKKLLAYSTISQLGLMLFAVGMGENEAALGHLLSHGFFKAGLFLSAGFFIYHLHHKSQSIEEVVSISAFFPIERLAFVLCFAALAGVPLTAGFFSKEALLEISLRQPIMLVLFVCISFLTAFYAFRVVLMLLKTNSNAKDNPNKTMSLVLVVLAIFSLGFWNFEPEIHFISLSISLLTLFSGGFVAWSLKEKKLEYQWIADFFYLNDFYRFSSRRVLYSSGAIWIWDRKYLDGMVNGLAKMVFVLAHSTKFFDKVVVDGLVGVLVGLVKTLGSGLRSFEGQKLQTYIVTTGLLLVFIILLLSI